MKESRLAKDFDPAHLAEATGGYSGADIKAVCREASMAPLRRSLNGLTAMQIREKRDAGELTDLLTEVSQKDFFDALITMQQSISKDEVEKFEKWTEEFGIR